MAKVRPGQIDLEQESEAENSAILPPPLIYVTEPGTDHVHISNDRRTTFCGLAYEKNHGLIVSLTPLGKPRCPTCLERSGSKPRTTEPVPFHGFEHDTPREAPPTQKMPTPPVQPLLPQAFFESKKK